LKFISICNGGTWSCTKKHCSKTCSILGTNHIQTFDGKNYDVRGNCEYILVQVKYFLLIKNQSKYVYLGN
jgi:hypothetical protein